MHNSNFSLAPSENITRWQFRQFIASYLPCASKIATSCQAICSKIVSTKKSFIVP